MNEQPVRKGNRLDGYDYSQAGCYFVTICVKGRRELLGKIVGDGVLDVPSCELSDAGKAVEAQIQAMNALYANMQVTKYVIMPNHIHMIVFITGDGGPDGSSRTPTPTNAALPKYVSTLKRYTNRTCGASLWQRSYHDHIIRNETDYQSIWQYIDENPAKWREDRYFVPE